MTICSSSSSSYCYYTPRLPEDGSDSTSARRPSSRHLAAEGTNIISISITIDIDKALLL